MSIWNGRFKGRLDPGALKFSSSLEVDKRLYQEDIEGSIAHVAMLARQSIITRPESRRIQRALQEIKREIDLGKLRLDGRGGRFVAEDIHMAIEHRLMQKVGEVGGKLHTARSRNDQVALDERLFLIKSIRSMEKLIRTFQEVCLAKAERYETVIMPGYTHLQRAQPILLAHHLLAYVSMLERDRERFADCLNRVNRSPLGAGALAGTSFPIDRKFSAKRLGFDSVIENSIDAVSDRDIHIEFLSVCAIAMMHLSRFAEELVLWSSEEWEFVELGDAFTTGSSIMPQKKNPDMAELIRGKTGRVYGDLVALLTVMKGLPLAYNRDMQEDKEPLFDAADTVAGCLDIFSRMLKTATFNAERFNGESDLLLATELADYLVRKGMSFRKAHSVVGAVVRDCIAKRQSLKEFSLQSFRRHSDLFNEDLTKLLSNRASILNKKSSGSTSPKEVRKALNSWRKSFRRTSHAPSNR
jgi:argininosuccinate lyase